MKNFLLHFAAVNPKVMARSNSEAQARYAVLGMNLLVSCIMAFIGGFDVAHQFSDNLYIDAAGGLALAGIVFNIDYSAMRNNDVHWSARLLRVPVGISNVAVTTLSLMVLLNQSTIDNELRLQDSHAVHVLDSVYTTGHAQRFATYNQEVKDLAAYHEKNCVPEALNGYPGPMYKVKDSVCVLKRAELAAELKQLNADEKPIAQSYHDQRLPLLKQTHNDFFAKAAVIPVIIGKNKLVAWLMGAVALLLLYLELSPLITKMTMNGENDGYKKNVVLFSAEEDKLGELLILDDIARDKGRRDEELGRQEMAERESGFDQDADRLQLYAKWEAEMGVSAEMLEDKGLYKSAQLAEQIKNRHVPTAQFSGAVLAGILRMNAVMRKLADELIKGSEPAALEKAIFDRLAGMLKYDAHGNGYHLDAATTFNLGKGLFGELSFVLLAFYRHAGIPAFFALVSKDGQQDAGSHACVALPRAGGAYELADPGQRLFPALHQQYQVLRDDELVMIYNKWNQ